MKLKANNNVKIASNKAAGDVFRDLYKKDKDFKKYADQVHQSSVKKLSEQTVNKEYPQVYNNLLLKAKAKNYIKNPRNQINALAGVAAVSYTHLDVYKRQRFSCKRNS